MLLALRVPVESLAPAARHRRVLQLCLAGLWLLDGVLQVQVFMFSHGFADSVADAAGVNPAVIAGPVSWTSRLIGAHGAVATIAIAVVEVLIGLGIAWRPTVRLALGVSLAWALGVWWLGEGFGGLFTPDANAVAGAPGAVIIYAMLAVVLWPPRQAADRSAGAAGGTVVSGPAATALWLLLWGGLAVLSLWQAVTAPTTLQRYFSDMAGGQPHWLASADTALAGQLEHNGAAVSLVLAGLLAAIAAAVFLPAPGRRLVLGVAAALAVVVWSIGQGFGGILTGMATDPNSGPLLLLAIVAYWPARAVVTADASVDAGEPAGVGQAPPGAHGSSDGQRGWVRRDIDVMNILMAIAMASMLAGRLNPVLEIVWLVTFAAASAWFAGHAVRVWLRRAMPGQQVMHLLSCGGMLVMLAAPRAGAGAMSIAGGGTMSIAGAGARPAVLVPTLAAMFAVAMAGSVVVLTDRLPALPGVQRRPSFARARSAGRPSLRLSCQVALGLAMACMLIQML